jgi:galactokinase
MFRTATTPRTDPSPYTDITIFDEQVQSTHRNFFDSAKDVIQTRVPGRLDLMGGISDYSGSLVCEMPIQQAVVLALQERDDDFILIETLQQEDHIASTQFRCRIPDVIPSDHPVDYTRVRTNFKKDPHTAWAAYIAGALPVLVHHRIIPPPKQGFSILCSSQIPMGGGVSSSAAIEVAAMLALLAHFKIEMDGVQLAVLAQEVENSIVGAPCGLMDQLTVTLGKKNAALLIRCQPADIEGYLTIPPNLYVAGIHSGVKHSIGGSRYTETRIATFMGKQIIFDRLMPTAMKNRWSHLASIPPEFYCRYFKSHLPATIKGSTFLTQYDTFCDSATEVDSQKIYPVRSRTEHPIYENHRVEQFVRALNGDPPNFTIAAHAMYGSNWSYNRCGMGSTETNYLVRNLRDFRGIWGARITGGGAGGTVAVLFDKHGEKNIHTVLKKYTQRFNLHPELILGSSDGGLIHGFIRRRYP